MPRLYWIALSLCLVACSTTTQRTAATATLPAGTTPLPAADSAQQTESAIAGGNPAADSTFPESHTDANSAALAQASLGDEVALRALALVGKPYRYGGADLDGFDCSGLVYFVYHQLGFDVPRTAQDQQREAARVPRKKLAPGDLVFFKLKRRGVVSHVGIYVGDNRFVHAPQSGKLIELRTLDDRYFAARWFAAGRFD